MMLMFLYLCLPFRQLYGAMKVHSWGAAMKGRWGQLVLHNSAQIHLLPREYLAPLLVYIGHLASIV